MAGMRKGIIPPVIKPVKIPKGKGLINRTVPNILAPTVKKVKIVVPKNGGIAGGRPNVSIPTVRKVKIVMPKTGGITGKGNK
jgi:hypothetical protein